MAYPAGSPAEKGARSFVEFLEPHLPAFAIDFQYLPGGGGMKMLAALASAPADGLTIGWVTTPALAARAIDHNASDLTERIHLLGQIEREPIAFVSPSGDPASTIQDIIRRASEDADAVPLATPPAGSPGHLAALRLQVLAQTQLNIVTFPSAAAARQAVLSGNVSAAALSLSEVIGALRSGDLSAIGIAARRRFGLLPDAPVLDEDGIPLSAFIRRGIAVPAGVPAEITMMLTDALREAANEDTFKDRAAEAGYYGAWEEGAAWANRTRTEQAELAKLWETNPWMSSSGG
jgi:tripartite-type tricarboxylate transporter receptor subunit TctC